MKEKVVKGNMKKPMKEIEERLKENEENINLHTKNERFIYYLCDK
jgi:hypothetical protein